VYNYLNELNSRIWKYCCEFWCEYVCLHSLWKIKHT